MEEIELADLGPVDLGRQAAFGKRLRVSSVPEVDPGELAPLNIHPGEEGESSGDDDDEDDDGEWSDGNNENRIEYVPEASTLNVYRAVMGENEDLNELDEKLADYTAEDWAGLADNLLRIKLDKHSSKRDVVMAVRLFDKLFCSPFKDAYSVIDRVRALYPNPTNMHDQLKRIRHAFHQIRAESFRRGFDNLETAHGREFSKMLTFISFGIRFTYKGMVNSNMLIHMKDQSVRSMLQEHNPETLWKAPDLGKSKPHNQLIEFYWTEAFNQGLRKDGDCLYAPRRNDNDEFVHAYEYLCEVSDFVYQSVFPIEQNRYWYECLTARSNVPRMCIDILSRVKCEWLPELERNYQIHAFQNGLFVLQLNEFFYFNEVPGKYHVSNLKGNLTAIKYHDMPFDEVGIERDMRRAGTYNYMAVQMNEVHQIFAHQQFDMKERSWIFALLGRMLHPLGALDNWGVFPYFLGLAGTGKSTALRLLASLFEARDVGYLNNVLQRTFALEGICDKLIYFALDIDDKFSLDQTTLQSMVVGEEVSVLRKYKQPMTVKWKVHGGMAGNKLPKWTDNGGSIRRRIVVVEFLQPVVRCDPNLFEKCLKLSDRMLYVINSAYLDKVKKHQKVGIKGALPEKFRRSEQKALLEMNVLLSFLQDHCDIDEKKDKSYHVKWSLFNKVYKEYIKRNSIEGRHTMNYTYYNGVFAKYQIKVRDAPKNPASDPFNCGSKYILGIKFKSQVLHEYQIEDD